jgi:predicted nucleic acid-binding Zn finger protein
MNQQIQELKQQVRMHSTYAKAQVIAASKNIHKSTQGNIWMVEGSKAGSFYSIQYIEGELMCECPAYVYGATDPCKHVIAISLLEVSA